MPIAVPAEAGCGLIGRAALVQSVAGRHASPAAASDAMVEVAEEVAPDPAWADTHARMQPVFDRLCRHSQAIYDDLDALTG